MVKRCGPACPEQPDHHRPAMPPIEPLVSVSSINGMQGDVVLKDLIFGDKHYNGSDQKKIVPADLGLGKAFKYEKEVATIEKAEAKMEEAQCGEVYFCRENNKFYLSIGEGEYKTFNDNEGGKGPEEYLVNALVSGQTLQLTKNDGSIITFTVDLSSIEARLNAKQDKLIAGESIKIENNVISVTNAYKISGMYIGSVVRDPSNPAPQRNLIGLVKDTDVNDVESLIDTGYENYIADNYSCTCFAYPQSLGTLTSITMNDTPFEMLPSFNRFDNYTAGDGTKFYIYTYNQTVNPEYNKYSLKWK